MVGSKALDEAHISRRAAGKHTSRVEQQEFTTQTDVFVEQVLVTLSHGSSIEHRVAGAQ